MRFNDAGRGRYFEVGHRRIRFTHYVGYLQVGSLGIEVLPKADRGAAARGEGGMWHEGLLRMLETASGLRLSSPSDAAQRTARASLLELVAARFVEATERLLREGLGKGYRDEESNGPTFRGRLLVYPSEGARAEALMGRYAERGHTCETLRLGLFDAGAFSTLRIERDIKVLLESLSG